MILYQVTPFLNNVSFFESFCSFKVGCFTAKKNASRFFLLRFIGVDIRTFRWKTWSGCWNRCLAGSESLFGFSCPFQHFVCFHLCNFPNKNRLPHIFYMNDMDFSPSIRKVMKESILKRKMFKCSHFLKAVIHKFYLMLSWIPWTIWQYTFSSAMVYLEADLGLLQHQRWSTLW